MAQIKIRPSDLIQASNEIQRIGLNLEIYETEMTQKIMETSYKWEGAAESAFYQEYFERLQPFLTRDLRNVIKGLCEQLYGVVNAIDDADADIASGMR